MGASTGGMKRTSKCPQSDAPVHGDNRGCPTCVSSKTIRTATDVWVRSNCWATCVTGRAMRVYVHRVRVSPLAEAVGLRGHAAALLVAWPYCGPIPDGP